MAVLIGRAARGYDFPLSQTAIRDAYFLGTKGPSSGSAFLGEYTHKVNQLKVGAWMSEIGLETPFAHVAIHASKAVNYSAQDAGKEFLGKPVVFRMHLDICYLSGAPENAIRVTVLQNNKTIQWTSENRTPFLNTWHSGWPCPRSREPGAQRGSLATTSCRCYISCRGKSMTLAEQIQTDIVVAMKARDDFKLSVLRMVKSAIQLKEVEKLRKLDDAESIQLLQTILKQRKESIEQFTKGNRPELAEKEKKEAALIEQYLPAGASAEEMNAAIDKVIAETGASSIKQMGAVVKAAKSALEGKTVDGKALSDLVRERLAKLS